MSTTTEKSLFLQAFAGRNDRIPVWIMRQAGRFLPSYRKIRERHGLKEMFQNPELAAEVTCLPVNELGVDAAILFADILTLPDYLGFTVEFVEGRGPVFDERLTEERLTRSLPDLETIPYLEEEIGLIRQRLPAGIPLIGFAGAPFTVLTYLAAGGGGDARAAIRLALRDPAAYTKAMDWLTHNTIRYLRRQQAAGIQAFQLFDTWGGQLRPTDYETWVLPYVQKIFASIDLPSIYYLKNSAPFLAQMVRCGAEFLSVCETVDFAADTVFAASGKGVQGNLWNMFLYADRPRLEQELHAVLSAAVKYPRYIFNLSHGIFPDINPEAVKRLVEGVHQFKSGKR